MCIEREAMARYLDFPWEQLPNKQRVSGVYLQKVSGTYAIGIGVYRAVEGREVILCLCYFILEQTGLGTMHSEEELCSVGIAISGDEGGSNEDPQRGTKAVDKQANARVEVPPMKGGEEQKGKTSAFVLGEGIPPVPASLVARIWDDEYVDTAK